MEWVFAKKIVLCLLIVLNVILFFLNSNQIENYNIAAHQKTDIISVLQNFNLTLDPTIELSRTATERLKVGSFSYSEEVISQAFFQNEDIVSVQNSLGHTVYTSESFLMTLSGNTGRVMQHADFDPHHTTIQSVDDMIALAENTKDRLESVFGELQQTYVATAGSDYVVEYVSLYKGSAIFSNYFTITIGDDGRVSIQFQYFDLLGTEIESKNIISVDEALFSFMRTFQQEGHITSVSIGYYLPNQDSAYLDDVELYLEPCYEISLLDHPTSYLIEGYHGERIV